MKIQVIFELHWISIKWKVKSSSSCSGSVSSEEPSYNGSKSDEESSHLRVSIKKWRVESSSSFYKKRVKSSSSRSGSMSSEEPSYNGSMSGEESSHLRVSIKKWRFKLQCVKWRVKSSSSFYKKVKSQVAIDQCQVTNSCNYKLVEESNSL